MRQVDTKYSPKFSRHSQNTNVDTSHNCSLSNWSIWQWPGYLLAFRHSSWCSGWELCIISSYIGCLLHINCSVVCKHKTRRGTEWAGWLRRSRGSMDEYTLDDGNMFSSLFPSCFGSFLFWLLFHFSFIHLQNIYSYRSTYLGINHECPGTARETEIKDQYP